PGARPSPRRRRSGRASLASLLVSTSPAMRARVVASLERVEAIEIAHRLPVALSRFQRALDVRVAERVARDRPRMRVITHQGEVDAVEQVVETKEIGSH